MTKVIVGLLVLLLGLLGSALATQMPSPNLANLANLERAFAATGAARLEISMNGWAELRAGERTQSELKHLLTAAARTAFGVVATAQYTEDADMRMASVAFTAGAFHVEANVQALHAATYLVATVRSSHADVWAIEQALDDFFAATLVTPAITACLVGVIGGRLSPREAEVLVGSVLRVLAADMLDFYSDGNVLNLTAYSRMLPAGITLGERKTNLSLSMRYNEQDGNTWVWLSWPTCAAII